MEVIVRKLGKAKRVEKYLGFKQNTVLYKEKGMRFCLPNYCLKDTKRSKIDAQGQISANSRYPHLCDHCAFSGETLRELCKLCRLRVLCKHCLINFLQRPERKWGDGK